jgi:hypothetical protein
MEKDITMAYNLFISHSWAYGDAYEKLIKLLKEAPRFEYKDYSVPRHDPVHKASSAMALHEAIKRQMQPANCVIVLAGVYATYSKWINEEINLAHMGFSVRKPVLAIEPWGSEKTSISPFHAEWEILERGKNTSRYRPFHAVEVLVPFVFIGVHHCTDNSGHALGKPPIWMSSVDFPLNAAVIAPAVVSAGRPGQTSPFIARQTRACLNFEVRDAHRSRLSPRPASTMSKSEMSDFDWRAASGGRRSLSSKFRYAFLPPCDE